MYPGEELNIFYFNGATSCCSVTMTDKAFRSVAEFSLSAAHAECCNFCSVVLGVLGL